MNMTKWSQGELSGRRVPRQFHPKEQRMERSVESLLSLYNPHDPLDKAWTIPSPWYFEPRIAELENETVFGKNWQAAGRVDQVKDKGCFFTAEVAGEPVVV